MSLAVIASARSEIKQQLIEALQAAGFDVKPADEGIEVGEIRATAIGEWIAETIGIDRTHSAAAPENVALTAHVIRRGIQNCGEDALTVEALIAAAKAGASIRIETRHKEASSCAA